MSGFRSPCAAVSVNGTALAGVASVELHGSGGYQAGCFSVQVAAGPGGPDLAWWGQQPTLMTDIRLSLDGVQFVPMMLGEVDCVRADPIAGTVRLEGRDLTARFIDAQTDDLFANQTASEIVTTLAERRGLTVSVTASDGLSGRYYGDDHGQLSLGRLARSRTEWDLLAELARLEAQPLYVAGNELHFGTMSDDPPFPVFWDATTNTSNVEALSLDLYPAMARGVQVAVQSWQSCNGAGVSGRSGNAGGVSLTILRPNLSADVVQRLADDLQNSVAAHTRQITFRLPGELTLTPRSTVQLSGDLAGWTGNYAVLSIVRRLTLHAGFQQTVTAQWAM